VAIILTKRRKKREEKGFKKISTKRISFGCVSGEFSGLCRAACMCWLVSLSFSPSFSLCSGLTGAQNLECGDDESHWIADQRSGFGIAFWTSLAEKL
jgi:hypothetical protein